jgi:SAM-dependent methyltransferase
MDPYSVDAVRGAYDAVADDYVDAFGDDLDRLALDRRVLDAAVTAAPGDGWVLEAGCGPAPAAGYLADRAHRMLGVDLSGEMLRRAVTRNDGLRAVQGDVRRLPLRDGCCRLVVAHYSLQHVPWDHLGPVLGELRRVLAADGLLTVATHLGDGDLHMDEFLGHRIATMAGAFHDRSSLLDLLAASGFDLEHEWQRDPLPHEYGSRRLYLLTRPRAA